jgi:zinc protease
VVVCIPIDATIARRKGYTYGISSSFSGSRNKGPFTIASGVRSNVTFESVNLIKDILMQYGKNFNDTDLEVTKGYLIKVMQEL